MEPPPQLPAQPEAGPSRRSPSPPQQQTSMEAADIVMEALQRSDLLALPTERNDGDDAVSLLLNIAESRDAPAPPPPPPLDPAPRETSISPKEAAFPYTPPDEPPAHFSQNAVASSSSLSHILETNSRSSPSPPPAPKPRQRRAGRGGGSRRTSRPTADTDHPPHWMGEGNMTIRCICRMTEDDGFTIQCEGCGAWEHGQCFGYLDEASAPETYFCELCDPRPVDVEAAINRQMQSRMLANRDRIDFPPIEQPVPEAQRPKGKGKKRTRTGSVMEGEPDEGKESPNAMGPPAPKPKIKRPSAKQPRQKPLSSGTRDPTPGPSTTTATTFKEPLPPVELEDDYFKKEPWTMEYTPLRENIVRGKLARQIMATVYREWVDADVEDLAISKRTMPNPSGLPSPTETGILRLSPEALFAPPDFNILAPPIPPVFLAGADLDDLTTPSSVRSVDETQSFLPLNYAEVASSGVYSRPAIYGVFLDEPAPLGSFLGELKGEVTDCESYRRDPINQYAGLGTTKPFVRAIGPPVNLVIDARGYGCDLRFVRSSCHPNAVLRPLLWRKSETSSPQLKFGLFASRDISKQEEITLGWEWDDQHVVHSIRSAVLTGLLPEGEHAIPESTMRDIADKYESVLTHLFGTFTSCACIASARCALAQMRSLVEGNDPLVELKANGKARVDMGQLIGAVRGWRRREVEVHDAKRWARREVQRNRPSRPLVRSIDPDTSMEIGTTVESKDVDVDGDEAMPSAPISPVIRRRSRGDSPLSSIPDTSPLVLTNGLRPLDPESEDEGNVSDATTATVPRSQSSGSETEEPAESPKASRRTAKPVKRIASPESNDEHSAARPRKRTPSKGSSPPPKRRAMQGKPRSKRDTAIYSSDESGSEPVKSEPRSKPSSKPKDPVPSRWPKFKKKDFDAPKLAVVPDQVVAPMSEAIEVVPVPQDVVMEEVVPSEEALLNREPSPMREPTPKEPTPPPKSPSPPPPPPVKVSLTEYLSRRKMAQDKPTPSTEDPSSSDSPAAPTTALPIEQDETPTVDEQSKVEEVKPDIDSSRLNLMEFLPSKNAAPMPSTPSLGLTSLPAESPRPIVTPSSSYVPRNDYFPAQNGTPSTSYVPRNVSSSYTPRQNSIPTPSEPERTVLTPPNPPAPLPVTNGYDIPPVLAHREPPPHQANQANNVRQPPTGPKVPPTGPRGSWSTPAPPVNPRPVDTMRPNGTPNHFGHGFRPRGGFGDRFGDGFGYRGRGGFRGRGGRP